LLESYCFVYLNQTIITIVHRAPVDKIKATKIGTFLQKISFHSILLPRFLPEVKNATPF